MEGSKQLPQLKFIAWKCIEPSQMKRTFKKKPSCAPVLRRKQAKLLATILIIVNYSFCCRHKIGIMVTITCLRHGQSEFNAGNHEVFDAKLTELGKQQASKVEGHFDLVICSTLTRTLETLEHSKISYDELKRLEEAREKRCNICDFLSGEDPVMESNREMTRRMIKLKEILIELSKSYSNILLIGHKMTFKYFTATNYEELINDETNTVEPNGFTFNNCQMMKHALL